MIGTSQVGKGISHGNRPGVIDARGPCLAYKNTNNLSTVTGRLNIACTNRLPVCTFKAVQQSQPSMAELEPEPCPLILKVRFAFATTPLSCTSYAHRQSGTIPRSRICADFDDTAEWAPELVRVTRDIRRDPTGLEHTRWLIQPHYLDASGFPRTPETNCTGASR